MLQARVESTDLIVVKAVTDNLEGSHNETETKDLNMVNASFKVIAIREVHLNKTVCNMAIIANPISREVKQIAIEAEPMITLDDNTNTLSTCTFLNCDEYRTDHDGQIDTTR